MNKYTSVACL